MPTKVQLKAPSSWPTGQGAQALVRFKMTRAVSIRRYLPDPGSFAARIAYSTALSNGNSPLAQARGDRRQEPSNERSYDCVTLLFAGSLQANHRQGSEDTIYELPNDQERGTLDAQDMLML